MADAGGVDIDLYADVDADFQADELTANENTGDLYDDVLTSNVKEEKILKTAEDGAPATPTSLASIAAPLSAGTTQGAPVGRRYQLYIGNLTWWTTDADIADSVASVGVSDFIEVKFYENRANGQSKGYCCVSVASEASMRTLMDKLDKKELHGQTPVITYATKQALLQFEAQSKTRPPAQPPNSTNGGRPSLPASGLGALPPGAGTGQPPPRVMMGGPHRGPPPMRGPPPPVQGYARTLPPGMRGPPPAQMVGGLPSVGMRLPPPGMVPHSAPPPIIAGPPPSLPRALPPPGPAPHVNPAFFPPSGPPPTSYPGMPSVHGLSEVEFEEIMSRNRTVSSSAIARAVQDASCNEYGSAIETLVTAISLIKQSKVAGDDRCKILISSLQDTLHGIENKSYARRDRSRSRERAFRSSNRYQRSYSREEDYGERYRDRERDFYREGSRSRERDYRSREDKYYEERERYKERERMRDPDRDRERDRLESSSRMRDDIGRERGDGQREKDRDRERERSRH